jgi:GNAT superfamily N-acetyltransferase
MDRQADPYRIRLARPDEVPRLREIEPDQGRRGLGARLLGTVCAWARAQGHPAVEARVFMRRDLG